MFLHVAFPPLADSTLCAERPPRRSTSAYGWYARHLLGGLAVLPHRESRRSILRELGGLPQSQATPFLPYWFV